MAALHGLATPPTAALDALANARALANVKSGAALGSATKGDPKTKARAAATSFEAQFLSSMFNEMYTGIDGDGPFGGGTGVGVWRSFLSEQYAKSFAKAGGIGIADHVYRALIAQQEAAAPPAPQPAVAKPADAAP